MRTAASALLICLAGLSVQGCLGRDLLQSSSTIDPWVPGMPYPDVKLSPGGKLTFKWPGAHGVYRIPSGTCPDVFAPGNGLTELSPVVSNGVYTTPALAAGTYWYACQVPGHCASGQIVKVIVA